MTAPVPAARPVSEVSATELVDLALRAIEQGQLFNAAHFLRVAADRLELAGRQTELVIRLMGLKP